MTFSVQSVRPAAVAGAFYPGGAGELRSVVDGFLQAATARAVNGGPLRALVVPHAGYAYSGPIAATGYAVLERQPVKPRRVVVLGPAHTVGVRGLALPECGALATPLGQVRMDPEGVAVAKSLPQVISSSRVHEREHSIEVQLPFLQRVLGDDFTVVPLAVGHCQAREVAEVINALWTKETLVVVSSDLSHYLPWEEARAIDQLTADTIVALDAERLDSDQACGAAPLRGLMLAAKERALTVHLLDLRNSGDTAGDRQRVVGYGAFALTAAPEVRS